MQKFQNTEHSNSRTFQRLSKAWKYFSKFKDFQKLLKDPINPGKGKGKRDEAPPNKNFLRMPLQTAIFEICSVSQSMI